MDEEMTVDDIGQLVKTALTGDEKLRNKATRLLALLPSYFGNSKKAKNPKSEHINAFRKILNKEEKV